MNWPFYRRRGPDRKQGWAGQAQTGNSVPPCPLLTVFTIVILLLSFSHYTGYRSRLEQTAANLRLLLLLSPVLLIFFIASYAMNTEDGLFGSWLRRPQHGWVSGYAHRQSKQDPVPRQGGSPWGIAALVVVLLVLVWYQSSLHSMWLGPLGRAD